jgi:hypothetical protein
MLKSLQQGITLWVQAKTGLTVALFAWLAIAAAAVVHDVRFSVRYRVRLVVHQARARFGPAGNGGHFPAGRRCCRNGLGCFTAANQATCHS